MPRCQHPPAPARRALHSGASPPAAISFAGTSPSRIPHSSTHRAYGPIPRAVAGPTPSPSSVKRRYALHFLFLFSHFCRRYADVNQIYAVLRGKCYILSFFLIRSLFLCLISFIEFHSSDMQHTTFCSVSFIFCSIFSCRYYSCSFHTYSSSHLMYI